MDQHVTYHPITDDLLRSYRYYISGQDGARVAAEHCAAVAMGDAHTTRFLDLLPHFAAPAAYPFDQTHGFSIALTQGFFGPYFYVNGGQLSALGDLVGPYSQPWQRAFADWDAAATAQNTVLSQFSSGVFIAAGQVAAFMSDAHTVPELAQALATNFPGDKLGVFWTALQYAHDAGAGLLEAAGALEPNPNDLAASTCFTRLDNCDQAGLHLYVGGQGTASPVPPAPELELPPHLADRVAVNAGARLPSTPSLTERLRAKRGDVSASAADADKPASPTAASALPVSAADQLPPPPSAARVAANADAAEQFPPPPATATAAPATDANANADKQFPPPPAPAPQTTDADATDDEQMPPPPAPAPPQTDADADANQQFPPPPAPAPQTTDAEQMPPPPAPPAPQAADDANAEVNEQLPALPASATDDEQMPPPPAPPMIGADLPLDVTLGRAMVPSGQSFDLVSGVTGPAEVEYDKGGWSPNRFHWHTHIEGHAAAILRQYQLQELELTTNHPDGVCRACDFQAPAMMSPGTRLVVRTPGPDDTTRTQWIDQQGVHDHDPDDDSPITSTDDRVRLRPGGCWGQGSVYFDTWDNAWDHVEGLIGMYPFFFDVTHMGAAWEPFSLVGTQRGTAVIEFIRSTAPFRMRLHGLGLVSPVADLVPVQVQWTADEPDPVTLGIDTIHLLPPNLARDAADFLIKTDDRSTLAFNEVPVFPGAESSRSNLRARLKSRTDRAKNLKRPEPLVALHKLGCDG